MKPIDVLKVFDDNPLWKHQLVRLIAEVKEGGGDFMEILWTASKIKSGDTEDWYSKWKQLAEEKEAAAEENLKAGHTITARKLFLKACNYYRMANFFLLPDDPRDVETYDRMVGCFIKASRFFTHEFEQVSIDYDGYKLPGYLIKPSRERKRYPVVIMFGGLDAVKEEYYFRGTFDCIERGMAYLLVEGPGQGALLRKDKLYLIHDYERPVAAIVDYLEKKRDDIDSSKIALVGASLGGYFALRAAAFEHRLKACVALSAIYDLKEDVYDFFPPIRRRFKAVLGVKQDEEPLDKIQNFTVKGLVKNIKCPLLIVHGEADYLVSVDAAYKAYNEAICDKTLKIYKKDELGSHHIQHDHLDEAKSFMFDWIAEKLAR